MELMHSRVGQGTPVLFIHWPHETVCPGVTSSHAYTSRRELGEGNSSEYRHGYSLNLVLPKSAHVRDSQYNFVWL